MILENNNYSWFKAWKNNQQAALIISLDFNIIDCNEAYKKKFAAINIENQNFISILKNMNQLVWEKKSFPIEISTPILQHQNTLTEKILHTSHENHISISFAYFLVAGGEFRSSLVQILPMFNEQQEFYSSLLLIGEYTMWGAFDIFGDPAPPKANQIVKLMDSNHLPPIKLTPSQYTIILFLTHNISIRKSAELLNVSYGNISKMIRDIIAPKFDIFDGDSEKLIAKAIKLGYKCLIPQILCRPYIQVLDDLIISKYGLE